MSIDLCATILEIAGGESPVPLHGKSLFGGEVKDRKYVFAAREKMDETHDAMRAIRSKEFKLIHNLMPERPYTQYNNYKESGYPYLAMMNVMHMKGQLTPEQAAFMAPNKPEFELYDLRNDPHEVNNLTDDPAYAGVKDELLAELYHWRETVILDKGVELDYRALDVFPETCPTPTVDEWVFHNQDKFDFNKHGWPAWYPTRTLEEWEELVEIWKPWVFRPADSSMTRPVIGLKAKEKAAQRAKAK